MQSILNLYKSEVTCFGVKSKTTSKNFLLKQKRLCQNSNIFFLYFYIYFNLFCIREGPNWNKEQCFILAFKPKNPALGWSDLARIRLLSQKQHTCQMCSRILNCTMPSGTACAKDLCILCLFVPLSPLMLWCQAAIVQSGEVGIGSVVPPSVSLSVSSCCH